MDKDRDKRNLIRLRDVKIHGNNEKKLLYKVTINNEVGIIKFENISSRF